MANIITLSNGENVTLFSDRDIIDIIERFCGYDFAKYVSGLLEDRTEIISTLNELITDNLNTLDNYNKKRNDEYDNAQDHYDKTMENLTVISETIKDKQIKESVSQIVDRTIKEADNMKEIIENLYDISGDMYQYADDLYNNMYDLI